MEATAYTRNAQLRQHLCELMGGSAHRGKGAVETVFRVAASVDAPSDRAAPVHAVVTINEINQEHGTGPLVKRIFAGRCGVLSIRSRDDWGVQDFGDWNVRIDQRSRSRAECFGNVLRVLKGRNVKTVTCVPFLADELLTSIAIKEAFGARLCVYLMDDQNVAVPIIDDSLMREFLEKASLRLATHPELRDAYERKYGLRFYLLPAVVPAGLITAELAAPCYGSRDHRAALLGSFWDQTWFDRLCGVLESCHYQVDWFGQNRSPWVMFPPESLKRAGITARGVLAEDRLAAELRKYPFVIVPGGMLDAAESNAGVASLSLPGRILFAAAASHTPILMVGSDRSSGAHFVRHFGIGLVVPYDETAVREAMARLSEPRLQTEMRRNAAAIGPALSDRGVSAWLERSIELGEPADLRFESFFASYNEDRNLPVCTGSRFNTPFTQSAAAGPDV